MNTTSEKESNSNRSNTNSTKKVKKAKKVRPSRITKKASCIRRAISTSRVQRKHMIDAPSFDEAVYIKEKSGKFHALVQKIRDLDSADERRDGQKYKHLIFTDVKDSSYGAKALAGFLIAAGYRFQLGKERKIVKRKGKEVETKTGQTIYIPSEAVPGGADTFAILQSVPLWKNPISTTTKKHLLQVFNSRPDNIHGEHLRLIVLDSKYKEGIDLFDVRYVHLLEPSIATSDLKQAVGRATRYCGQKGLTFIPNKGWPLEVFIYNMELPGRPPFSKEEQKADAHTLMLEFSGLDLALLNITEELTRLAIVTAVDYDLCYNINNFSIDEAAADAIEAVVEVVPAQQGGAKKKVAVHDVADITPEVLLACSRRKSKLFPYTKLQIIDTARSMGIKIGKTAKRGRACELLKTHPDLLAKLLTLPTARIAKDRPFHGVSDRALSPQSDRGSSALSTIVSPRFPTPRSFPSMPATPYSALAPLFATPEASARTLKSISKLPFKEFQQAVVDMYGQFGWDSPIVKSGCDSVSAASYGKPVSFTKTQDFVRHYLTPGSPFKGILAWHSVGTGKTCMAVAAASTAFESAGYNILWVTRNALMADVYKNIFGSVCSIPLINAIEEKGLVIPHERGKAKRLLSRSWFAPVTYRMLQNAIKKENALGRMLWEQNPGDPLKKTFLIIDEVHKLQDGDLSASEAADFKFIQKAIWDSYETSGNDSVRTLLMTATPIADKPGELFSILNTLISTPSKRLMEFEDFREKFTNDSGHISQDGKEYFQEKAKGLISYLNREFDPTTFAQPRFHAVIVPPGEAYTPNVDELVQSCAAALTLENPEEPADCSLLEDELEAELAAIEAGEGTKKVKRELSRTVKANHKSRIKACKAAARSTKKAHKSAMKSLLKEATICFRKTKKAHAAIRKVSQIVEVERCLGKPSKTDFVPLRDFKEAVANRFTRSSRSLRSINAVRMEE